MNDDTIDQDVYDKATSLSIIVAILKLYGCTYEIILFPGRGDGIYIDCPESVREKVAQALEEAVGNVIE